MSSEMQVIEERVYISNVDYKATADELKEFFKSFKVIEVDIPVKSFNRGKKVYKKHLGFAFVQFNSKADAEKAIEQFNGKEFKSRKIYMKKAIPPPTDEEKQKKIDEYRAMMAEKKKEKEEANAAGEDGNFSATGTSENGEIESYASTKKIRQNSKAKFKKYKSIDSNESNISESADEPMEKSKNEHIQGEKSTDTIFITNLDYNVDVQTMNDLFKKLKPKWVHVPTKRRIFYGPRNRRISGKSIQNKGFAFIKFSNEELQRQAIKEFNGKELNGRPIIVDIAISGIHKSHREFKSEDEVNPEKTKTEGKAILSEETIKNEDNVASSEKNINGSQNQEKQP